jgi:UDP-N-acetylenolpyruvoylglucosamine reductase
MPFSSVASSMLLTNVSLLPYNTFGIAASARYFARIESLPQLQQVLVEPQLQGLPLLVLGGGSNLLFTHDFDGLVLQMALAGRSIQSQDDNSALVEAQAGERWHDFVLWTLQQGWCGLENLALIPGSVGAAPIQNIGAYGVEIKDRMHSLQALDLHTGEVVTLNVDDCQFGYRDSLFKQQGKGRYIILSVTFKLYRQRELKLDYGDVAAELQQQGISQPTSLDVAHAVMVDPPAQTARPGANRQCRQLLQKPAGQRRTPGTDPRRLSQRPGLPATRRPVQTRRRLADRFMRLERPKPRPCRRLRKTGAGAGEPRRRDWRGNPGASA